MSINRGAIMTNISRTVALLIFALALPPLAHAQSGSAAAPIAVSGTYAELWKKGNVMESKALSRLIKAQSKLAKANRDIAAATNKQATSASAGTIAAADFRQITASVPTFAGSPDAKLWAKRVSDAAERWTKADKRGTQGSKDLTRATKNQQAATADIAKAQSDAEQGRSIMADARSRSGGL
jgi:uncharacterized protein YraI